MEHIAVPTRPTTWIRPILCSIISRWTNRAEADSFRVSPIQPYFLVKSRRAVGFSNIQRFGIPDANQALAILTAALRERYLNEREHGS